MINNVFFQKVKLREQQETERDKVIDPRESWKHWFKRTATFEEPPMVDRDELPEDKKPHRASLFNKVENMMNGINPYPPGHKWNKKGDREANSVPNENNVIFRDDNQERDEYLDEECKERDKENDTPASMIFKRDQMTLHD